MRIIYYTWEENSRDDMVGTLRGLGHEVAVCAAPCRDYEYDVELAASLEEIMRSQHIDCLFSFNFFPVLAKTAECCKVKYVSWIYDCPHWTLFSPAVKSAYNDIFVFDRQQYQQLKAVGVRRCYHFPMAVNTTRLEAQLEENGTGQESLTQGSIQGWDSLEVSFVGSLYENNLYDRVQYLPEYIRGYLSGIMEAQERIYGYNFVSELLTDEIVTQMEQFISMDLPQGYFVTKRELFASMLNGKITCRDRMGLLRELSEHFNLTMYTASDITGLPRARAGGIVDYVSQMPKVFRNSKININISLRSIQSGIPLRALDIMGAGGFLLSNYQPELAEYFEDGKELTLYTSAQDLVDKAAYYLAHEEERKAIAEAGFAKVKRLFSYEVRVEEMLRLADVL
ncbi:MAG: glycosyltransferase [Lachnospiraceae bacterium]|nr:glycosyltransferase [Lachnospiraceae bacterium]